MMLRALILASGLLVASPVAGGGDPAIEDLVANRKAMAEDFVDRIVDCVARQDTDAPVFHGCADWTSAVQGYWALAAVGRVTGDNELVATLESALSAEGIAKEREILAKNSAFAMPYGRAWLLRLAIEFEETTGNDRLKPIADESAAALIVYFGDRRIDPLSSFERSDSWPLLNLRAYGLYRGDARMVAFVDDKVSAVHLWPCQFDADEVVGSFVAICTNWAQLVGESRGGAEGSKAIRLILSSDGSFRPVSQPGSGKLFGLNFSRAAGLWELWRKTGERAYLVAYADHVRRAYRNRDWWGGSYESVGHWVPQLGVLAILPLFDASNN